MYMFSECVLLMYVHVYVQRMFTYTVYVQCMFMYIFNMRQQLTLTLSHMHIKFQICLHVHIYEHVPIRLCILQCKVTSIKKKKSVRRDLLLTGAVDVTLHRGMCVCI